MDEISDSMSNLSSESQDCETMKVSFTHSF